MTRSKPFRPGRVAIDGVRPGRGPWLALAGALLLVGAAGAEEASHSGHGAHQVIAAEAITWGPPPPGLPAGMQIAVLAGDPAADGPFTVRAVMPDGYAIPPHWHPGSDEHLTVLSGRLHAGMGESMTASQVAVVGAGGFAVMPAGMRHWIRAEGETVVQVHGTGPFVIHYVNPADDPRGEVR
jgi:mannose-6-phosphate isomerase-like protein (cupin superfamily)